MVCAGAFDALEEKLRRSEGNKNTLEQLYESSNEDTLFIADSTYGDLNQIIVYPRKVKGGE